MCFCFERCKFLLCIPQNEAVMSAHGGVPQKSVHKTQNVGDVSIFQVE